MPCLHGRAEKSSGIGRLPATEMKRSGIEVGAGNPKKKACAGRISTDAVLARQGGEIFRDRQAARDRDETEWNRGLRRQSEKKACRANV